MVAAVGLLLPASLGSTISVFGVTLQTAAGLTVAGQLVNFAAVSLLSAAFRPDAPRPPRPDDIQINSKAAAGVRVGAYGFVKVGGNVVFHRAKDGISYRIVTHLEGESASIEQYFLNNDPVTLNGSGFVTEDQYQFGGRSRVQVQTRLGLVPSSHYSDLGAVYPVWTPNHRLDGITTSLIICESVPAANYRQVYPNNEPELQAVIRSRKIKATESAAPAFSENMALAIADYIASPDGMNRPQAVDWDEIEREAAICAQSVALAEGGSEPLYRIGGTFSFNERPQDVMQRMLDSCAGRVRLRPNGKVGLRVGAWVEPTVTLTYSQILEIAEGTAGADALERFNELPARFVSQDLGYVEVDAEAWTDPARLAEDGQTIVGEGRQLFFAPSHRQVRQVLKITTERENPRQRLTIVFKPSALEAVYEDVISLDVPEFGISGTFEVESYNLGFDRGALVTVTLTLRLVDQAAFTLALDEQGRVQTLPEPDTPAGVPLPQNVTAVGAGVEVAANEFAAGIAVVWDAPAADSLTAVVEYAAANTTNFEVITLTAGVNSAEIVGVVDGALYDVAVYFVTAGGVQGGKVLIEDVQALASSTPPDAPTNLAVTDQTGGQALVSFDQATSSGLVRTEIFRDGVLVGSIPRQELNEITFADQSGAGTFDWTAQSVNASGLRSALAGPVTQIIT